MASIDIIEGNDTPKYFALAQEIVDTIIQEQSLEVDAVSGATYSSKVILDAAFDTLVIYKGLFQDLHFDKAYIPLNSRSKLVNNK